MDRNNSRVGLLGAAFAFCLGVQPVAAAPAVSINIKLPLPYSEVNNLKEADADIAWLTKRKAEDEEKYGQRKADAEAFAEEVQKARGDWDTARNARDNLLRQPQTPERRNQATQLSQFMVRTNQAITQAQAKERVANNEASQIKTDLDTATVVLGSLEKWHTEVTAPVRPYMSCFAAGRVLAHLLADSPRSTDTSIGKPTQLVEEIRNKIASEMKTEYAPIRSRTIPAGPIPDIVDHSRRALVMRAIQQRGSAYMTRVRGAIEVDSKNYWGSGSNGDYQRSQAIAELNGIERDFNAAMRTARSGKGCDALNSVTAKAERAFWHAHGGYTDLGAGTVASQHYNPLPD